MTTVSCAVVGVLLIAGCATASASGQVLGLQAKYDEVATQIERTIWDGSKSPTCDPKAVALAEANLEFARTEIEDRKYSRAREHLDVARRWTEQAIANTNEECRFICEYPAEVFGPGDRDGDGHTDDDDKCPEDPEDFDSFEDMDGCPDRDNDGDGVEDASVFENGQWVNLDQLNEVDCRNEPEDPDGFADEDGCPDPDNDGDGIIDEYDDCPDEAEDLDGDGDEDGCPEPGGG